MSQILAWCLIAGLILFSVEQGFSLEAQNRVTISAPRLVNSFGSPILEQVNINQQIQITSVLTNKQTTSQDFVYIVQIKNQNGIIVALNWISGTLLPGQSFSPALSWMPESAGTYTAKIFVWQSLSNPDPLSEPAKITITAS